jgi:hypothetical protein
MGSIACALTKLVRGLFLSESLNCSKVVHWKAFSHDTPSIIDVTKPLK